jgi:hypothetical protein
VYRPNGGEVATEKKMTARELRQEYDAFSGEKWDKERKPVNFADYVATVVLPRECAIAVDQHDRERAAKYINEALVQVKPQVRAVSESHKVSNGLTVGKIEKL